VTAAVAPVGKGKHAAVPGSGAKPVVAVVGRPNVGKSTLVNRLVGRREAIVEESPGVTRDRKELEAEWGGRAFTIVDTGGWQPGGLALERLVSAQAEKAVEGADVVLFVVDATIGPTAEDEGVARFLLRSGRPVVLVVNKVDNEAREAAIWEFTGLGFRNPWPVSALHGRGSGDMLDALVAALPPIPPPGELGRRAPEALPRSMPGELGGEAPENLLGPGAPSAGASPAGPLSVAIVGRPNVGKSTLFNRLIGDERSIVHDLPGTTRDSIDTVVESPGGPVRFVDTAGLRRRTREAEGAEYYSVVRSLRAVDGANMAVLVLDASEGVTRQDQRLAERVDAAGNPIVVVLNKWDLVGREAKDLVRAQAADMLGFVLYAPALEVSARTGRNVERIYPALSTAAEAYGRRVPTPSLNQVVAAAQAAQPPPRGGRVLYATQGATNPPTFTLFASKELPASYLRYLEHAIRERFGFGPTPLKLRVRRRSR
jgi:GTP-binding protein